LPVSGGISFTLNIILNPSDRRISRVEAGGTSDTTEIISELSVKIVAVANLSLAKKPTIGLGAEELMGINSEYRIPLAQIPDKMGLQVPTVGDKNLIRLKTGKYHIVSRRDHSRFELKAAEINVDDLKGKLTFHRSSQEEPRIPSKNAINSRWPILEDRFNVGED